MDSLDKKRKKKAKKEKASAATAAEAEEAEEAEVLQEEPQEPKNKKKKKQKRLEDGGERAAEEEHPPAASSSASSAEASAFPPPRPGFLSSTRFGDLPLSEGTRCALHEMGFEYMTKIQDKSVAPLLAGKDLLGAAKTGSGKVSNPVGCGAQGLVPPRVADAFMCRSPMRLS